MSEYFTLNLETVVQHTNIITLYYGTLLYTDVRLTLHVCLESTTGAQNSDVQSILERLRTCVYICHVEVACQRCS